MPRSESYLQYEWCFDASEIAFFHSLPSEYLHVSSSVDFPSEMHRFFPLSPFCGEQVKAGRGWNAAAYGCEFISC